MIHWIIEVRDSRDKDSGQPWSHFIDCYGAKELRESLMQLAGYMLRHDIVEVKIVKV